MYLDYGKFKCISNPPASFFIPSPRVAFRIISMYEYMLLPKLSKAATTKTRLSRCQEAGVLGSTSACCGVNVTCRKSTQFCLRLHYQKITITQACRRSIRPLVTKHQRLRYWIHLVGQATCIHGICEMGSASKAVAGCEMYISRRPGFLGCK